jgi:hypothetical protein
MIPIDAEKMQQDLSWLRRIARRVVELPIEMGVEDLSNAEIRNETDKLMKKALLKAIRYHQLFYRRQPLIAPELLYEYLWCLLYFSLVSRTGKTENVAEEMKELLTKTIEEICDFVDEEYDRRLNEIENQKNKESQP